MEIFNDREIALGIWFLITVAFAASQKSIRSAIPPVWKAFCNKLILVPLGLMAGYIGLVVFALHEIGLWDVGQLKNTIFWSVSVAAVSFFRIPQVAKDEHYFRGAIKDNFKVVAVFEFVVTFYTFPLWAEFLIVPVATFLVAMQTYAEGKGEYAAAEKLLVGLLTLFGGGLVAHAGYKLVADFSTFAQLATLTDFTLPIVLSLLLLPFLFVLGLYVNYENAFLRLSLTIKDAPLRRYAKRAALFGFHVRTGLLKRWLRNIGTRTPTNRQEVKSSIAQLKALASREKHPAAVPLAQGWSPYRAREFLTGKDLIPGDYHQDPFDDAQWFASSPYLEIGKAIFSDNVAYYVEGDEYVARRLRLIVNFNNPETADKTRWHFAEIAGELFRRALDQEMPVEFHTNIMTETPTNRTLAGKTVELASEAWPSGRGHELRFIIESGAKDKQPALMLEPQL